MSAFTFTSNVPDGPNDPSEDQPIMEVNNNSIEDIWDVDHVGFNLNQGGTHNVVRLNQQTVNPTLIATQGVLFQKIVSGNTELFYKYGSAPQNTFQVTNNGAVAADIGVSSLLGPEAAPLRIQWGFIGSLSATTSGSVVFASPFSTNCYVVSPTVFFNTTFPGDSRTVTTQRKTGVSPSTTGFNWRYVTTSSEADQGFYWIAIGS